MEPLKEIYSSHWIQNLSFLVSQIDPKIKASDFQKKIMESPWKNYELKARINRIADTFLFFWNIPLDKIEPKLTTLIKLLRKQGVSDFNFPYIFLNDIVVKSGIQDFETSMRILEKTTVFSSAEFAIRFYYINFFEKTVRQMEEWSNHKEPFVRRLASEGSRPILPWGIGVPAIKRQPEIHLSILENLWNDENEIVRRSVSNHLNDISKLQPDLVLEFCKNKFGVSEILDKNLKHALRGLLKKADVRALSYFQYDTKWKPEDFKLTLTKNKIKIGDSLEFHLSFLNPSTKNIKIRIEYKIGFLLANGKLGKKVFQLGEKLLKSKEKIEINKKHSFNPITTRVYYPGKHSITIVINGSECETSQFELLNGK